MSQNKRILRSCLIVFIIMIFILSVVQSEAKSEPTLTFNSMAAEKDHD